ncbi:MAG: hypothetical protein IPO56_06125 [Flavobacteriales bacterium]|nr:hypothetical protein [Flavobacteriales bacterium]
MRCVPSMRVSADTRIGQGTKMDNHVQVGHDTRIGTNCGISGVAIAGAVSDRRWRCAVGQVGIRAK